MNKSFYDYYEFVILETYFEKGTPIYNFVTDMIRDREFPRSSDNKEEILHYLEEKRACDGAIAAFKKLWKAYSQNKMIDRDALADAIIKEFEGEELTHEEWRTINHILNIIADAEIATEKGAQNE